MEKKVIMDNRGVIAEALRAFGQAIDNDRGVIDGGAFLDPMIVLASLLESNKPVELEEMLHLLGIRKDDDGYRWEW